jgi:serine/threonine-protein kinase RsbW
VTVRLLDPQEAPLLIGLIRRCYGETYIDPTFYDGSLVRALLANGKLHSIGAFSVSGELVGHMGITSRPWGGATSDAGMTLVDPLHRGKGIARQVAVGLAQQSVALGLIGVHDYPVTVHGATQRLAKGFGVDTGLMLVNMPADVAFREMETPAPGQRSSSLMRWLPFGRAPQRDVYLPERYHERLVSLYAEARLPRSIREADATVSVQLSELEVVLDTRRKIARIGVTRIGADLDARVEAETRTASDGGAIVGHVDLPLSDPGAPFAAVVLRAMGYSFAGLLPEYRDGDVLRMQWLSLEAHASAAVVLSTDATRAIESFVVEDRAELVAR